MEKILSKIIVGQKRYTEKEIAYYVKNGWKIVDKKVWSDKRVTCKLEYVRTY